MPHHLRKHPVTGAFYFRQAVPRFLRAAVGRTEILLPLQTKDPTEARIRGYIQSAKTAECIRGLKANMTKENLAGLIKLDTEFEFNGIKVRTKSDSNSEADLKAQALLNRQILELAASGLMKIPRSHALGASGDRQNASGTNGVSHPISLKEAIEKTE